VTKCFWSYFKLHQLTNLKISPACYVLNVDEVLFSAFKVPNKAVTFAARSSRPFQFSFFQKTAFSLELGFSDNFTILKMVGRWSLYFLAELLNAFVHVLLRMLG
jgi:hypothetical protein